VLHVQATVGLTCAHALTGQTLRAALGALRVCFVSLTPLGSDGKAFAALGPTRIDHRTTATGLHANEKAVRTCATDLGRLVSTFHFLSFREKPVIIPNFHRYGNGPACLIH